MRRICAWCKREMTPVDNTTDDDLISHGICEECKKLVMAGTERLMVRGYKLDIKRGGI